MRKICLSCGFICFVSDENCKKCGSDKFTKSSFPIEPESPKQTSALWSYLLCFLIALIIEFFALFPILANLGMRHSANAARTQSEINDGYLLFIFHLPTILLAYGLDKLLPGPSFSIFTPFTQIIFWTILLISLYYRRLNKSKF